MIEVDSFTQTVTDYIHAHSGLETRRPYVGFSGAGKCPRRVYRDYFGGVDISDVSQRMCYAGYMFEREARNILEGCGMVRPGSQRKIVSDFSENFHGHTDGETVWGDLLEIKSVTENKFSDICRKEKALFEHFRQVQLYMHYGGYKRCWFFYISRETFQNKIIMAHYSQRVALEGIAWGKAMLEAVETMTEPACVCGRCV